MVVQVALALVLLVGSGLMIRTFQALRNMHPGFTQPEQRPVAAHFDSGRTGEGAGSRDADAAGDAGQAGGDSRASTSVSFAAALPLEGFNSSDVVYAQDKVYTSGEIPPIRRFRFVAPGYLKAVGTPLIAGRDFTWTDLYDRRHVAMVSENMAREMWGDPAAALGKHIREGLSEPWREVVGVAADVHETASHAKAPATVYWPALMNNFRGDQVSGHARRRVPGA